MSDGATFIFFWGVPPVTIYRLGGYFCATLPHSLLDVAVLQLRNGSLISTIIPRQTDNSYTAGTPRDFYGAIPSKPFID